ncbi:U3 small nucleolar ribonucleoprotein protein MPP10-like [Physella acuta]|uniref:U3 small nucleolar ribonucleoprotein protein MPP10-like n=1 Tax=Physella acuta TaxID=109671 RepID=UPI0027DB9CC0|nr:U3 small nucleolar ribonucleoprotein protein MPP10-like [Physella acuta]
MATKTRMPKKAKVKQDTNNESNKTSKTKASSSSPLSTLMMLGSQLLSSGRFNEGLPSFVTRGLDSEQIWQQLELRNEHKLSFPACTRELVRISSESQRKQKAKSRKNKKAPPQVKESVEGEESGLSSGSDSSAEDDILSSIKKRLAEEPSETGVDDGFDDEDDDSDEDDKLDFDFEVDNEIVRGLSDDENDTEEKDKGRSKSSNNKLAKPVQKRKTIVDDRFFKLSDMEQFLEEEDLKEEKKLRKEKLNRENDDEDEDDDDDESDEEIDMFGEIESDSEKDPMYAEFFDPPDDESDLKKIKKNKQKDTTTKDKLDKDQEDAEDDESGEEEEELDEEDEESDENEEEDMNIDEKEDENQSEDMDDEESDEETKLKSGDDSTKKVSFSSDLLQSDEEEETNKKVKEDKSSFELKQEKLLAKAREMEELSLKEAPWELKGEASASKRPENSLLETVLDFQHTTRPAPVITEETTKTLEDYIKQRIKDKTFDDVERKEKPKEDVFEFKKRIVLDQEKSKLSLGQLYEQEFVKQQQQDKEEVKADPECEKIEKELGKLFHQLDALCNFKYTPMKPGTEVKILVNTPAITMEEVAPVATADADLLAPEEVLEKRKGELKAKDEKTATDKNRERRQKKKEKKERKKAKEAREKVVEKLKPGLGNKYSKAKALKQLEQISKSDKNVTLIKGDNKKMSSSTSFFTQLQEEVQTNNKAKKVTKEKTKKVLDANKLML